MPTDLTPNEADDLDQRLSRALQTAPQPLISVGFAARVSAAAAASTVPGASPVGRARPIGQVLAYSALAVLFVLMLLTARPHSLLIESSLTVEFILLTLWLTLRSQLER